MFKKKKTKVVRLTENAVLPKKAHKSDAGYDLTAISKKFNPMDNVMEYGTGLAIQIPEGHVGLLFSRSSVYKTGLSLANAVGVLDHGFSGEVKFMFKVYGNNTNQYNIGNRVGQLVIVPLLTTGIEEVDKLGDSSRGEGGFGSTGK